MPRRRPVPTTDDPCTWQELVEFHNGRRGRFGPCLLSPASVETRVAAARLLGDVVGMLGKDAAQKLLADLTPAYTPQAAKGPKPGPRVEGLAELAEAAILFYVRGNIPYKITGLSKRLARAHNLKYRRGAPIPIDHWPARVAEAHRALLYAKKMLAKPAHIPPASFNPFAWPGFPGSGHSHRTRLEAALAPSVQGEVTQLNTDRIAAALLGVPLVPSINPLGAPESKMGDTRSPNKRTETS